MLPRRLACSGLKLGLPQDLATIHSKGEWRNSRHNQSCFTSGWETSSRASERESERETERRSHTRDLPTLLQVPSRETFGTGSERPASGLHQACGRVRQVAGTTAETYVPARRTKTWLLVCALSAAATVVEAEWHTESVTGHVVDHNVMDAQPLVVEAAEVTPGFLGTQSGSRG